MGFVDESAVRYLFRARVESVLPRGTPLALENRAFRPPSLQDGEGPIPLYVREQFRMLDETRSSTGFIEAIGEALYMVEMPTNRGTEAGDKLVRLIADSLQAGQSLTGPDLTVILEHTDRRPPRPNPDDPAWTFKTVACRWRTFTTATPV